MLWSMLLDGPLTNYLAQTCVSKGASACMCESVCFGHDSVCNLGNCSVIVKVAGPGHESCQVILLQVHAFQLQLSLQCYSAFCLFSPPIIFPIAAVLKPSILKSRKSFLYISY